MEDETRGEVFAMEDDNCGEGTKTELDNGLVVEAHNGFFDLYCGDVRKLPKKFKRLNPDAK